MATDCTPKSLRLTYQTTRCHNSKDLHKKLHHHGKPRPHITTVQYNKTGVNFHSICQIRQKCHVLLNSHHVTVKSVVTMCNDVLYILWFNGPVFSNIVYLKNKGIKNTKVNPVTQAYLCGKCSVLYNHHPLHIESFPVAKGDSSMKTKNACRCNASVCRNVHFILCCEK